MHHHLVNTRILSVLAVGGIFCLMAGSAHAQRSSARATGTRAASTTSTTGSSTSATGTTCPSNSSTSSTGATSGTTTTGTTLSSASALRYTSTTQNQLTQNQSTQSQSTSLSSSTIQAVRTSSNQLAVQYSGSTSGVQAVYMAVLDANRNVLQQQVITQNPTQATLSLTSTARYYGVKVTYTNGTSKMLVTAIK